MTLMNGKTFRNDAGIHATTCSMSRVRPCGNLARNVLFLLTIFLGFASSDIAQAKEKAGAPVVVREENDLIQFGKPTVKKDWAGTNVYVTVKNISAEEIKVCAVRATFLKGDEILSTSVTLFTQVAPDQSKIVHCNWNIATDTRGSTSE
jgi:hypothetical protein